MSAVGIIGGSGLAALPELQQLEPRPVETPYGPPSGPLVSGRIDGQDVVFLARHGQPHVIPPHMVNYRANVWSLRDAGVKHIVAVNAVGAIREGLAPGRIILPDQIVDYTWGRAHTFFECEPDRVVHAEFTQPYSEPMRRCILQCARTLGIDIVPTSTYGATQGPRLESAAEITRMERDGCDIVGMTGMPEAALARELNLEYCSLCVVANLAAGKSREPITMTMIEANLQRGLEAVRTLLVSVVTALASASSGG